MPAPAIVRGSAVLLTVLTIGVMLSLSSPSSAFPQDQSQTPASTRSGFRCEAEPLPPVPDVGLPQRDHLAPITVENANQLSALSAWDLQLEEGEPQWQLSSLFFDPYSGLLARFQTGHIFFQMSGWHVWNVSSPFAPIDLNSVPGTGYDYTFWTYTDTVFTSAGYARARVSAEFPDSAQDWGGSAMPNKRWVTYQRSGGPDIIVQEEYVGQRYSPEVWLKLSADGSRLVVYYPGMLYVWDAEQERKLASVSLGETPYLVGFSPDNQHVITVEDETFVVRRIEPGQLVEVLSIPGAWGEAEALPMPQFMPDNSLHFVRAAGMTLEVWDLGSPDPMSTYAMPCVTVREMAFSPDGSLLAISADCSTTAGRHASEVQIWQTGTMTEVAAFPVDSAVTDLAFSPDGYLLALGDAAHTALWGIRTE
jgi:WD40 repeat protein